MVIERKVPYATHKENPIVDWTFERNKRQVESAIKGGQN